MVDEALSGKLGRSGHVTRPTAAAAVALLLALAACTTGASGEREGSGGQTATSGQAAAGGRTSPSAVWSSGPQGRPRRDGAGEAALTEVRAARQDGYDRLVFQFSGGLPGYQARYVDQVTTAGGEQLALQGTAFLLLAFEGAGGGAAGFPQRDLRPRLNALKEVRLLDEGGGRLRFAVGLDAVAGYLAHELTGPDRVIVDVAA
jgi:hypothetical protein